MLLKNICMNTKINENKCPTIFNDISYNKVSSLQNIHLNGNSIEAKLQMIIDLSNTYISQIKNNKE